MNDTIFLIVEGDGEEDAAPLLVRRLLHERQRYNLKLRAYKALGNGNITTPGGIERMLEVTRGRLGCAGVLVLLDAEKAHRDCPPDLAFHLARRAEAIGLLFPVVVVCAVCEYESWFLHSFHTIKDSLRPGVTYEGAAEQECSAKGWLKRNMPAGRTYKETIDQVKMTQLIDIPYLIEHSRSFQRLVHAIEELLSAIESAASIVTPSRPETE